MNRFLSVGSIVFIATAVNQSLPAEPSRAHYEALPIGSSRVQEVVSRGERTTLNGLDRKDSKRAAGRRAVGPKPARVKTTSRVSAKKVGTSSSRPATRGLRAADGAKRRASVRTSAKPSSLQSTGASSSGSANSHSAARTPAAASRTASDRTAAHRSGPANQAKPSASTRNPSQPAVKPLALSWPVTGRKIVRAYGERMNPTTRTFTTNPGVNIEAVSGSDVRAAAAGRVTVISWLPGHGTFVIVQHRDGYRTVYANLSKAVVARGAVVKTGQKIGLLKTIKSTSGGKKASTYVHFEVWRDQTRLNPTALLR